MFETSCIQFTVENKRKILVDLCSKIQKAMEGQQKINVFKEKTKNKNEKSSLPFDFDMLVY